MTKITCILIDDEPLALALLKGNVEAIEWLELKATFTSSKKALDYLSVYTTDVVFMDIQMPAMTGIELSKHLGKETAVIFTTAFDHYAAESYNLNAVDYLLKPIDQDRFRTACEKAREKINRLRDLSRQKTILVSSEHEKYVIHLDDILYIEGLKDYVKIFLVQQPKPLLTRMNLKAMEELLSSGSFSRIHKSYIVNKSKISQFNSRCVVINGVEIPLGDKYKSLTGSG
ncbi:MAG: response regulator transcription factor [Bacteroidetes bacterium]|nr:response regulator transcription factor [Bacteroidota bacterium]